MLLPVLREPTCDRNNKALLTGDKNKQLLPHKKYPTVRLEKVQSVLVVEQSRSCFASSCEGNDGTTMARDGSSNPLLTC